jgi:hypothetical protein
MVAKQNTNKKKINHKALTAAWQERAKLRAEGDKLWAEGNLCWANAVIAEHGPKTEIKWNGDNCTVAGVTYEKIK